VQQSVIASLQRATMRCNVQRCVATLCRVARCASSRRGLEARIAIAAKWKEDAHLLVPFHIRKTRTLSCKIRTLICETRTLICGDCGALACYRRRRA
jgi:hypothetical protein